jgi:HD-GYP domain-containing protein (c-di-GMP phosphodiesterase class II)
MNEALSALHPYFNDQDVNALQRGLLSSLLVMAWAVEARDPYTGGHLWRVSQMARILASAAGVTDLEAEKIAVGGFLHDLGKIAVPDQILTKAGRLTDEEFDVIRTHPDAGWRLVMEHPLASLVEAPIRSHHEMPNGKGYPNGLSSEQIPLAAKIVGICDAFDAMTSTRPYRAGMPIDKALGIIAANLGSQFDTELGKLFVAQGQEGVFDHIVSHSDHGIPLLSCGQCGPVIVIRRDQVAGEHVYCRCCAGEYVLAADEQHKQIALSTGKLATVDKLTEVADKRLIDELIDRLIAAT